MTKKSSFQVQGEGRLYNNKKSYLYIKNNKRHCGNDKWQTYQNASLIHLVMHAITQFVFICDLTYLNLNLHVLKPRCDDKRVQKSLIISHERETTLLPSHALLIGKFRKLSICQSHIVAFLWQSIGIARDSIVTFFGF